MKTISTYQQHHIMMQRLMKFQNLVSIEAKGEVSLEKETEHEIQSQPKIH